MFTGIVTAIGKVIDVREAGGVRRLGISTGRLPTCGGTTC
jgi:riboflavin synthase alpha subunit